MTKIESLRFIQIPILLLCLLLPFAAEASRPRPTGYVSDFAAVLKPQVRSELESVAGALERQTGIEFAVVTMKLEDQSIEDVANRLFEEWGIGKRGKDNGVLILLAPDSRQVRIETGYGLEGVLPDAVAGRIIREVMIPRFREGDLAGGLSEGVLTVIGTVTAGLGISFELPKGVTRPSRVTKGRSEGAGRLIFSLVFPLLFLYLWIRHPRLALLAYLFFPRGGGFYPGRGGFGGGGFGGFGGGLSGGGGATGRW